MSKTTPDRDYHRLDNLLKLDPSAIVNTEEIAAILRYSPRSMHRVTRRPGFPTSLPTGGQKKWRLGAVLTWAGTLSAPSSQTPSRQVNGKQDVVMTPVQRAVSEPCLEPADQLFMFSAVRGASDAASPFTVIDRTWAQFIESLREPEARGHLPRADYLEATHSADPKVRASARRLKDGEAWVPALFGNEPNDRGNDRWAGNVLAVTALVLDIDNAKVAAPILTVDEVLDAMPSDLCLAWHTTYSHTLQRPRFRLVVPWRMPQPTWEHERCVQAAQRRFNGRLDEVSLSPATLYYLPSCPADALDDYRTDHRGTRLAEPKDLLGDWEDR